MPCNESGSSLLINNLVEDVRFCYERPLFIRCNTPVDQDCLPSSSPLLVEEGLLSCQIISADVARLQRSGEKQRIWLRLRL